MPLNFGLIVLVKTEDCRKPKGHFQQVARCTQTNGAKSATTTLRSTSATKAV